MKLKDISIGNWVYFNDRYWQVENIMERKIHLKSLHELGYILYFYIEANVDIYPISITKQIYENNGFRRVITDNDDHEWRLYIDDYTVIINETNYFVKIEKDSETIFYFKYNLELFLHELQNILTLCDIEKEFIL